MIGTKGLTSPQIEIPASAVGSPRVGHPHATGGLCDLPACNAANYDGHEVWGDATAYARDHHPDGSVCEMFGPCGRDICHKARCAMTDTKGLTSPQIEIPDAARDAVLDNVPRGYRIDAYAGLDKAAPLIVAAALDRQDDVIDAELQGAEPANFEEDNYDAGYIAGLTFAQDQLRKRITELKAGV